MTAAAEEIVWQGRYMAAKRRGPWEYAARTRGIGAAMILAIEDGHVLLVEQWRAPLQRFCLELPAGLVADDTEGESVEESAARELEEETGWQPAKVEVIGEFASSPGLTSETFTLVRATGLTRVNDGGGVAGEEITVHRIAMGDISAFVQSKRIEGVAIDARLLLLLAAGLV